MANHICEKDINTGIEKLKISGSDGNGSQITTPEDKQSIKQIFYESICEKSMKHIVCFIESESVNVNTVFNEQFVSMQYHTWTPLHIACKKGNVELVEWLLNREADPKIEDKKGETPLHVACKHGHDKCVRTLLNANEFLKDKQNKQGLTPLCKALYRLETAFKENNYYKTIELLINAGCNVNLSPVTNMTPLHLVAKRWSSKAVVEKLIAAGAQVNIVTTDSSPLMSALCRQRVDSETVLALIKAGADVNYKNPSGKAVLHVAVAKSEDICVGHLLLAGADPNIKDADGNSPLWIAVSENNVRITPLLLGHGGDVNFANKEYNMSLLCKATFNRNKTITKMLLDSHADVDMMTSLGASALHYAVDNGNEDIIRLLLERNCYLGNYSLFKNLYDPQNALQIALSNGDADIVKLLLRYGFQVRMMSRESVLDIVRDDEELVEWLTYFLSTPQSLLHLARVKLRLVCGTDLIRVLEALVQGHHIPERLADIILMKDCEKSAGEEYDLDYCDWE
ncbi:ankyrin-3-like [Mya arenaria]|nr:ankyrin-3-like [Mya arenaria]